jgi:hypothetical protein
MLQKREQAPKCGSNEEEKKKYLVYIVSNGRIIDESMNGELGKI